MSDITKIIGECEALASEIAAAGINGFGNRVLAIRDQLEAMQGEAVGFQERVQPWMMECFGPVISADRVERNHRFLEEALELVQAAGATKAEAYQLVDYVYGRPEGELIQEVGGVMVTLAALCLAHGISMHECGEIELTRIWTCVAKIRAKQAAKPKHSPLPEHSPPAVPEGMVLVPMEPTKAMIDAVIDKAAKDEIGGSGWIELYKDVYRAMIEAGRGE